MSARTKEVQTICLPDPIIPRDFEPFRIDTKGWWLNLSDVHVPFHDRKTVELAVKTAKDQGAVGILLNGDIFDFHSISRWDTEPTAERYVVERELGLQLLAYLRGEFPKARIIFKEGNHEERLANFFLRKAPELFELDVIQLPSLMQFDRFGIEFVGDRKVIYFGKHLNVIHGHEYRPQIQSQISPARGLLLRAKASTSMGHLHKTSSCHDQTIKGHPIAAWSVACACDLHPWFSRLNGWNQGFAMMKHCDDGDFIFRNLQVIDGEVY